MRRLKYILLFAIICGVIPQMMAQKENSNWILGNAIAGGADTKVWMVTFSDTGIVEHNILPFPHGWVAGTTATWTNHHTGDMELFTDGISIYGKELKLIENGDKMYLTDDEIEDYKEKSKGLYYPFYAVFVPDPGDSSQVYLFKSSFVNYVPWPTTMSFYNKIIRDSSGNYTLLNPESPNIYMEENDSYYPQIIRHANGRDWWVLIMNQHKIHAFVLDSTGLWKSHEQETEYAATTVNSSYSMGNFHVNSSRFAYLRGRYSDPNDKYAQDIVLMGFNRCNGLFEEVETQKIPKDSLDFGTSGNPVPFYSAALSPDGRYLFVNSSYVLDQFDLSVEDWYQTKINLVKIPDTLRRSDTGYAFNSMFYGPDGRIYISHGASEIWLSVIDKPHRRGRDADLRLQGLKAPPDVKHQLSAPYIIDFDMGPMDESACDSLGLDNEVKALFRHDVTEMEQGRVDFRDLSRHNPTAWHWDFDDGNSSEERYPIHEYNKAGIYHVCLTASNVNGSDIFCEDVEILEPSRVEAIEGLDMHVYPVPVNTGVLHVENPSSVRGEYQIVNMNGVSVGHGEINGMTQRIGVGQLISGIYVLTIQSEGKLYSRKIVVE